MVSPEARSALAFSCIGHSFSHFFTAFFFVIVLALEDVWSLPYHELIQLWTVGALLYGLVALPAGWLADRWSASAMMIVFFIGMGGASILCGLTSGPVPLAIGLSGVGIFAAIYHPVGIPWLIRNADDGAVGKLTAINGLFGSLGVALAALLAGILIDAFGWRYAFIVPGLFSVATGLLMWGTHARGKLTDVQPVKKKLDINVGRNGLVVIFCILLIAMFCGGIIYQSTQASLPKLFDNRLSESMTEGVFGIGTMIAVVYGIGGFAQLVGGYLADRYPLKTVYITAWLLQVPLLWIAASVSGLPLVIVAIAMVMLNFSAFPAEDMLLARYTPAHRHGLAFGIKFVLVFVAAPISIQMVAKIEGLTGGLYWLYAILAGVSILIALIMLTVPPLRKEQAIAAPAE